MDRGVICMGLLSICIIVTLLGMLYQVYLTEWARGTEIGSTLPLMDRVRKDRNERLKYACTKIGKNYNEEPLNAEEWLRLPIMSRPRLYFSDKLKLLYCGVPKAGTTAWRRALLMVENDVNVTSPKDIDTDLAFHEAQRKRFLWTRFRGKSNRSLHELNHRLNNYYRVTGVREPLERMAAAYIDKLIPGGSGGRYYEGISRAIHRQFLGIHSKGSSSGLATFQEFAQEILSKRPSQLDIHWQPYNTICRPCRMRYDYITRVETMKEDAEYLAKKIGISRSLILPDREPKPTQPQPLLERTQTWLQSLHSIFFGRKASSLAVKEARKMEHTWQEKHLKYFKQLPKSWLQSLYNVYSKEYKLFDYPLPPFLEGWTGK